MSPNNRKYLTRLRRRTLLGAGVALAFSTALSAEIQSEKQDASRFFHGRQMDGAVLSPNGQRLAMLTTGKHGRIEMSVLDLASLVPVIVYTSAAADVQKVVWVNDSRLAFTLADLNEPDGKQDAGPGLFAVNHDGSQFKQLVERQMAWVKNGNDTSNMEPWNTFLLDGTTLRKGDEVMVIRPEAYDASGIGYVKLLKLNTKTGRVTELEGPLHTVAWWSDAGGELRVVMTRVAEKGKLLWKQPSSGQWQTLSEFNVFTEDGDLDVRYVRPDGKLYVSARRDRDKRAMWLLDPVTREWSSEPLAESPLFDVDAHVVANHDKVLGFRFTIDAEITQWLDPDMQALQQQIDKVLPRTVNRVTVPWRGKSPWILIDAFADIQPNMFFLFNRETRKFTRLGGTRPDIIAKNMASMTMIRIKARDNLEIPTWLTLPNGAASSKNLPMVVLVHGGPFVRAPSWAWDAEVQFLAARGYAVLQPQFRGTRGFGNIHFKSGWKQWGKAMQTDVADATRWAIAQGIADPKRIGIAGASYGGYSALMGLIRDPDLFQCGIAWVGVTDLDMLRTVKWSDMSPEFKLHGMPALIGDPIKDAADLKENSPLTHADRVKQPLLLAYGGKDVRVPIIHGQTFRKAIQKNNSAVDWVVYDDEGHGWRSPANQIDFWNRTARFLDKNLTAP